MNQVDKPGSTLSSDAGEPSIAQQSGSPAAGSAATTVEPLSAFPAIPREPHLAEIHIFPVLGFGNSCAAALNQKSPMATPDRASEQLKQYLAQLSPQVRGRLLAELERLLELGEPIPRTEELIDSLRAEFPNGPGGLNDPARLFFQPLEPVLVNGAPERTNSGQIARRSLVPIWDLIKTDLLATMAREYIENVTPVVSKPKEADKLVVGFRKKALGYLDGTIRSAEGSDKVRAALAMYTSSTAIFDDLAKMFTVFRASEALIKLANNLEAKIAKLDGPALAKVVDQLKMLRASNPDAIPFALTIVARRLATPWHLLHLATRAVESKAPAAIAATPYGLAVPMVLDQIGERRLLLAMALKSNRVMVAKGILKEIYDTEAALNNQIELGNSDWGKRLREEMAGVTAAIDAEMEASRTNVGQLHHVLAGLRPGRSLKDRLAQAVQKGRAAISDILPA
jgi:hypothetical protein